MPPHLHTKRYARLCKERQPESGDKLAKISWASLKDLNTADQQRNTGQLETDVAECRWTWTSWGVVAMDLSCLRVMMTMMTDAVNFRQGARHFHFAHKFPQNVGFSSRFCILDDNFPIRKNFRQLKIGELPLAFPPCHDAPAPCRFRFIAPPVKDSYRPVSWTAWSSRGRRHVWRHHGWASTVRRLNHE